MTTRQINEIILHCSATPNGRPTTVEEIDRWHQARGFHRSAPVGNLRLQSIGYHYVIYVDGSVHEGRHISEIGAHAAGHNSHSIGICLIGTDKFTPAQWAALSQLTTDLCWKFPRTLIVGHRDLPDVHKECPGFDVAAWTSGGTNFHGQHILEV